MLQIEQNNLLIENTLTEKIFPKDAASSKSLDRIITDFDFTLIHISSTLSDNNDVLLISIYLRCWEELASYGVEDYLLSRYSQFLGPLTILDKSQRQAGYNFSMTLDISQLASHDDSFKKELIHALSSLKRFCISCPFEVAFSRYDELAKTYANSNTYSEEIQSQLVNEPTIVINYRGVDESIYIKPSFDRVTVIFSTVFTDETDKVFGKVFLQEFLDARKRSVQNAPQVLYSHKVPPLDIQNLVKRVDNENKGYVTFVLFPRHLVKGEKRENTISHIQYFRTYFHYHIKCSKAYMHSRMRYRVREFLKILNRAKPEYVNEEGKVEKKTASGRRFDFN